MQEEKKLQKYSNIRKIGKVMVKILEICQMSYPNIYTVILKYKNNNIQIGVNNGNFYGKYTCLFDDNDLLNTNKYLFDNVLIDLKKTNNKIRTFCVHYSSKEKIVTITDRATSVSGGKLYREHQIV